MSSQKFAIGLAGMAGAGKSIVVKVAKENGYGILTMGDVVREEAEKRQLEPNPENLGKIMLDLRQKEGNSVIAKRCKAKIAVAKETKILVDGIRSLDEVEEFSKHFLKFNLMAVHASPETRFKRLYRRRRSDDPECWKTFHERDMRELSVGLGNAIVMAEYIIVNEVDFETAKARARETLRKAEEKWTK
jgi:dephospho-CoA kinase